MLPLQNIYKKSVISKIQKPLYPFTFMHDALNNRIANFELQINRLSANDALPAPAEWEGLWDEQNAIVQDFRMVKYPAREEKDMAWNIFSGVRDLFKMLQHDFSSKETQKMMLALQRLTYRTSEDLLQNPTFESIKAASEHIKIRQKDLAQVVEIFKNVKYIMTKDDKGTVVTQMDSTRQSHQVFWEAQQTIYTTLRQAKDVEYAQKHQEYLQKQQTFKDRLLQNIRNNEDRLQKSLGYKATVQEQIVKHNEKLSEDIGEIFRTRLLGWKAEAEKKLEDVTLQIQKYEQYIAEDEQKLEDVIAKNDENK